MKTRIILYADEGKILTDGEIYGSTVYLSEERNPSDFYEITEKEYNEVLEKIAEETKNV
jgi:hypothetical protein